MTDASAALEIRGDPSARQIRLARDDQRVAIAAGGEIPVGDGERCGAVEDQQPERRHLLRLSCALDPFDLDRIDRLAKSRRVDQRHGESAKSTRSVSTSRVVPGSSVTIARADPTSALNRLDFPAFGGPVMTTSRPSRTSRPARPWRASAASAVPDPDRAPRAPPRA